MGVSEGDGGLDRRTLIKRAAAAGAVVWTAPVIIDSLASPAAAATGLTGCHFITFNSNCSPDNNHTPCLVVSSCAFNSALTQCIGVTCNTDGSVDATVPSGCPTCTITAAQGKSGAACVPPDSCTPGCICTGTNGLCSTGAKSVHWSAISSPGYSQFSLFVTCT